MAEGSIASLDETRALLGREVQFEGADDVTRNDIRRKLEVYCFDCPLHYDAATARAHGYDGVIAPVSMTPLWALPAYWSPGAPPIFGPDKGDLRGRVQLEVPTPFSKGFNASAEAEYMAPLYPGDHLHGSTKLVEVTPKETRLGKGVFLTTETRLWKSTGELVSVERSTGYRYDPSPDRLGAMKAAVREPLQPSNGADKLDNPDVDWSRQIRFGEVGVGDELPQYRLWLSYQRIVMSVAQDRMWGPNHHNRDAARAGGLDDIIFNTRGYEMLFEITLRRWMGLDGRLQKLGPFKMGRSSHPGDTLVCGGQVTGTEQRDGKALVHLDVWVRNPRAEAAMGQASVALPA